MCQPTVAHGWHLCQGCARKLWRTSAGRLRRRHLAPVPENEDTVGAQLEAALEASKVSQRELARRLAVADGTKPESKRRWLAKVLADEVEEPEPDSLAAIAKALGLPAGHFKVRPAVRQSRRQTIASLQEQLAADRGVIAGLESRVEELERALRHALGDSE